MLRTLTRTPLGIIAAIAVLALVAGGVAAFASDDESTGESSGDGKKRTPTATDPKPPVADVEELLSSMSTEQKVGQLFVTDVAGTSATDVSDAEAAQNMERYGVATPAEVVAKYQPGGVIYFSANVADPQQMADFSAGLQDSARASGAGIGLLVSIDQEGGVITRIGEPATTWPGPAALAATGDPATAYTAANLSGVELRAMGITQNFAPVADVNVNPANPVIGIRSFGEDPQRVAQFVIEQVKGFQAAGVAPTIKHFPGHGDTTADSHYDVPTVSHSPADWERLDQPPFAAAIAAGVDSIMTAHLVVPGLDPTGTLATLSQPILTDLLRVKMGYTGVIVTDSLRMGAVTTSYPDPAVPPVMAFLAGADQLLLPENMDAAYQGVLAAVGDGRISQQRLDESVRRILSLKINRGVLTPTPGDLSTVGSPAHREQAAGMADKGVTMLVNKGVLPAQVGNVLVTGWGETTTGTLASALTESGVAAASRPTGEAPSAGQIRDTVAAAGGADLVVVTTNGPGLSRNASQIDLVRQLAGTGKKLVVVGVVGPNDLAYLGEVPCFITTYGYTPVMLAAVARVITGAVDPSGTLPMAVPTSSGQVMFPAGHGL